VQAHDGRRQGCQIGRRQERDRESSHHAVNPLGVARVPEASRALLGGLPREVLSAALYVGDLGRMDFTTITRSAGLFVLAGLLEIGGGWLVWQWLRSGRSVALGVFGGLVLFLYAIVPTFQPAHFGRVYAAYGGVFVLLALLWGWRIDGTTPDRWDVVGAMLVLSGVAVIMYAPRGL